MRREIRRDGSGPVGTCRGEAGGGSGNGAAPATGVRRRRAAAGDSPTAVRKTGVAALPRPPPGGLPAAPASARAAVQRQRMSKEKRCGGVGAGEGRGVAGSVGEGWTVDAGAGDAAWPGATGVPGLGPAWAGGGADRGGRAGDLEAVSLGAGVSIATPVPMVDPVGAAEAAGVGADPPLRNRATTRGAGVRATTVVATPARTTATAATASGRRARGAGARRGRGLKRSGRRSGRGNCASSSARISVVQASPEGSRGVSGPLARITFETLGATFWFGFHQGLLHCLQGGAEPRGDRTGWDAQRPGDLVPGHAEVEVEDHGGPELGTQRGQRPPGQAPRLDRVEAGGGGAQEQAEGEQAGQALAPVVGDGGVDRDPVQPGPHRADVTMTAVPAVGALEGLLGQVLGGGGVQDDPQDGPVDAQPVLLVLQLELVEDRAFLTPPLHPHVSRPLR